MRRSIVLSTVLAVSTAVLGACESKTETPNKPSATPAPVATTTPAPATPAPTGSPTANVKPGTTPEAKDVKKTDEKTSKDAKPMSTETPKAK